MASPTRCADHPLAMLAVGLWSAALPAGKAWMGPVSFLLALVASAALAPTASSCPAWSMRSPPASSSSG